MQEKPYTQYFLEKREQKAASVVFRRFVCFVLVVFFIFFAINYSFNQKYTYITISGKSMQPTLNPSPTLITYYENGIQKESWVQDGVYVEETNDVSYNDIIIIENTVSSEKKTIIKRALAFGGDYITIAKIKLEDGTSEFRFMRIKSNTSKVELLQENYIKSYRAWTDIYSPSQEQMPQDEGTQTVVYEVEFFETFYKSAYDSKLVPVKELGGEEVRFFKVPENEVFYMGDNRTNSTDSRWSGTVKKQKISGKVVQIVSNGTYFEGNYFYGFSRFGGFLSVVWKEILRFFGANI